MDVEPGQDKPLADGSQPTAAKLQAYVDANAGRYTDAAIIAELTRAGYAEDDVRAALATVARRETATPPTRRAMWTILAAYAITFAVLSLGMLSNAGEFRYLPDATGSIVILAISLAVALLLSLAWVGSRRGTMLLLALLLGLLGASLLGTGGVIGAVFLGLAIVFVVLAFRTTPKPSRRSRETLGALLSLPVVLLVLVAGICVATGLPIPRDL